MRSKIPPSKLSPGGDGYNMDILKSSGGNNTNVNVLGFVPNPNTMRGNESLFEMFLLQFQNAISLSFLHHKLNSPSNIVVEWSQKSQTSQTETKSIRAASSTRRFFYSTQQKVWCFFHLFGWARCFPNRTESTVLL